GQRRFTPVRSAGRPMGCKSPALLSDSRLTKLWRRLNMMVLTGVNRGRHSKRFAGKRAKSPLFCFHWARDGRILIACQASPLPSGSAEERGERPAVLFSRAFFP